MILRKCHASGVQIWAGNPGARDHIELQSCRNGTDTKKMRSESLCKRNKENLQTDDPRSILDRNRFGYKFKKIENRRHFQLLGWAVGHGQPQKLWNNGTL